MNVFDPYQARYFCSLQARPQAGLAQSLIALHESLPKHVTRLVEGTSHFDAHRASVLFAVERWFLFGVAQYRRALDMFVPSAAPWAQVTLYYASFYAANALLGMFGVWMKHETLVDVENGVQGQQEFRINRKAKPPTPTVRKGSHEAFWDVFYEACTQISPWVPSPFSTAVQPVNSDRTWQTKERNAINYDTWHAYDSAVRFKATFSAQRFRASLSGPLLQQLETTEGLLKLVHHFVGDLGVPSFALNGFNIAGNRARVFNNLVKAVPPNLVMKSELNALLPV